MISCFLFVTADPAFGETYHVDVSSGDDAHEGSKALPFKTIRRASESAGPGDRVIIHPGTYHEQIVGGRSGRERAPITYEGAGPEKTILCGAVRVKDWRRAGEVWIKAGLKPITRENSFVMIDEKRMLKEHQSPEGLTDGSYHLDGNGTYRIRLWAGADPNRDHAVDVYELDTAFNAGDRWGGSAKKWIVLRSLAIEKYGGHGISTDKRRPGDNSHWELDRVTVRYNNAEGVFHCLDDWFVHDCRFLRNRGHGCQINGARTLFVDNYSAENEWFGPYQDGGCGLLVGPDASAHDCLVKNCVFENNGAINGYGAGIYLEGRSHGNRIENNTIRFNTHSGIGFFGSSGNIVCNNVLIGNRGRPGEEVGAAFFVGHSLEGAPTRSQSNLVAHNTVWGYGSPLEVIAELLINGERHNRFINNLFIGCTNFTALPGNSPVTLERNGWFQALVPGEPVSSQSKSMIREIMKRVLNADPSSIDSDPVIGMDPGLKDTSKGDFRPKHDSPVVGRGIPLEVIPTDRDGLPRPPGRDPTLGAHELGGDR
ncbi:MAG: right-handed parallel beta-helix repeat-containing protein [Pseudomonadota bacterium]